MQLETILCALTVALPLFVTALKAQTVSWTQVGYSSAPSARENPGVAYDAAYTATKHAVTGMTKAAALDYAKKNIRINAVGPGPVETPLLAKGTGGDPHSYAAFVPMGRIGQPDEIADAVVWLLSDEARYVTGHTLPVDGGVCAQ